MGNKHRLITLFGMALILLTTGCLLLPGQALSPTPIPTLPPSPAVLTQTPAPAATQIPVAATAAPNPSPLPSLAPTTAASPTELLVETYMAYVQNNVLVVTHVLGGKALETREIMKSENNGAIQRVGWSPSGEYLAFTLIPATDAHLYVVDVKKDGKPIDLGIVDLLVGNDWGWSPDSKQLAFTHEYELWAYSPTGGAKKALTTHLGTNWLWSMPVFTPDGKSLWAVGSDYHNMDQHGNTRYQVYRIPLDGSGAGEYPPGHLAPVTGEISGGLPTDIRFSPDGQKLAIINSAYVENCGQKAGYQVGSATGKDLRDFPVPSLAGALGSDQSRIFYGDSLAWDPQNKGLWVNAVVRDCTIAADPVAGPQISLLSLDGQEQAQIPGDYTHLSLDPTGALLGVVNMKNKDEPHAQILGRDGHLVLDLGPGDLAVLQP